MILLCFCAVFSFLLYSIALFETLEDDTAGRPTSEQLGIQSYGISMTTLEEVFLKLGEDEKVEKEDRKAPIRKSSAKEMYVVFYSIVGSSIYSSLVLLVRVMVCVPCFLTLRW